MRAITWVTLSALSFAIACDSAKPVLAQAPLATDTVEERFARFLAGYRPKSQSLCQHLYSNVFYKNSRSGYTPYDSLPAVPERKLVHSATYQADSTRLIRETRYAFGSTDISILRPEVNYALLGESGKSTRITHKQVIRPQDHDAIVDIERWKLDCGDHHGLGIGYVYRNEPIYTILTKKSAVISDVQFSNDGKLDVTTIYANFPPDKDRYEFSFHTDIGVGFKQVCRREKVIGTTTLEYDCPGRTVDSFVPRRRIVQDEITALKLPARMVEEVVVEEFRKQSRFDDSVFRLEQYGLPDSAPTPPSSRRRVPLIALAGVCGLVTLLGLWRMGRRRTAARP